MLYDFACDPCIEASGNNPAYGVVTVSASIKTGPETPACEEHGPMRRIYGQQPKAINYLDTVGYLEQAYEGKWEVPSMVGGTRQVRAIIDSHVRDTHKGRELDAGRARDRGRSLQRRVGGR